MSDDHDYEMEADDEQCRDIFCENDEEPEGSVEPTYSERFPLDDAEIQITSVPGFSLLQWNFITQRMRIPQTSIQIPTEAAEQIIKWRDQQNEKS